jgi:hypothetical protein
VQLREGPCPPMASACQRFRPPRRGLNHRRAWQAAELAELRAAHARHGPAMALAAAEHATELAGLRHALDAAEAQAAVRAQTQQRALDELQARAAVAEMELEAGGRGVSGPTLSVSFAAVCCDQDFACGCGVCSCRKIEGRSRPAGGLGGGGGMAAFMHAARAREVARGEELERAAAQHASHRQEMERALASLTAEHGEVQEQQTAALEGSAERVRQHEATISTLRKEAVEAAAQHERAAARHSEQVATYEEQLRMIRQFASAAAAPR